MRDLKTRNIDSYFQGIIYYVVNLKIIKNIQSNIMYNLKMITGAVIAFAFILFFFANCSEDSANNIVKPDESIVGRWELTVRTVYLEESGGIFTKTLAEMGCEFYYFIFNTDSTCLKRYKCAGEDEKTFDGTFDASKRIIYDGESGEMQYTVAGGTLVTTHKENDVFHGLSTVKTEYSKVRELY